MVVECLPEAEAESKDGFVKPGDGAAETAREDGRCRGWLVLFESIKSAAATGREGEAEGEGSLSGLEAERSLRSCCMKTPGTGPESKPRRDCESSTPRWLGACAAASRRSR